MKKYILATLLATSTIAFSQTEPAAPSVTAEQKAAVLKMFDTNKDGVIDAAERADAAKYIKANEAALNAGQAAMMAKFDTDKNGKLEGEELVAAKAEHAKKQAEIEKAAVKAKQSN